MAEAMLKSAYEVARENRLKRNREMMQALGLASDNNETIKKDEEGNQTTTENEPRPMKADRKKREPLKPTRRSKRVQGLSPDGLPMVESDDEAVDESDDEEDDAMKIMQAKIERLKALHEARNTAYKNPTATYEHTWMRVRTMSDQALGRRISVIEKALGQHCVVKMRMFAEVLLLANKEGLAKDASAALDRLLALGLQ